MKNLILVPLIIILCFSCSLTQKQKNKELNKVQVKTDQDYELHQIQNSNIVLILFPGGASTSKEIKEEFEILPIATNNNISVLMMNFNRHLWIDANTTKQLAEKLEAIFNQYGLETENIFMGGMSIGGNVTLTLANYLHKEKSSFAPKGTFIVDAPIDLHALYESSVKDTNNPNFDEERLAEPKWIINYFEEEFGEDDDLVKNIQNVSPFTLKTKYINVSSLKKSKLRFYTEPDKQWWKENRQTDFESTNAFAIEQIADKLKNENWNQFELIETENKGYRSDGSRHPHSWSIVDIEELVNWIKE